MVEHDPQWDSGYRFFPELTATSADNRYQLRPIHWNDRDAIREWRNAQIEVLRQQNPLSDNEQDNYFSNLVLPQLTQEQPEQILFAFLEDSQLVGYGGFEGCRSFRVLDLLRLNELVRRHARMRLCERSSGASVSCDCRVGKKERKV